MKLLDYYYTIQKRWFFVDKYGALSKILEYTAALLYKVRSSSGYNDEWW